jgi:hypothetical protein
MLPPMTNPTFGDRVRIRDAEDARQRGFVGRVGDVFGESVPSSSGVGPVIGDRGDDFALSVFFDETGEQEWFAPHLVEFLDHGGPQTMSLEGGPTFARDPEGKWHEVGGPTAVGRFLNPGGSIPRLVAEPFGRRLRTRRP